MVQLHSVISSTHHIFTLAGTSASPVSDEIHKNIIHIYIIVQTKAQHTVTSGPRHKAGRLGCKQQDVFMYYYLNCTKTQPALRCGCYLSAGGQFALWTLKEYPGRMTHVSDVPTCYC